MKKITLLTAFIFSVLVIHAQYVGIGTTIPSFKLDVSGGSINTDSVYRINGGTVLSIKGTANTFVGTNSGASITTGNSNTAVGSNSFFTSTVGTSNSAFGKGSLYSNINGYGNTAIGNESLYSNTSGSYNAGIGAYSMYQNTTGSYNAVLGSAALYYNINGAYNVASGYASLNKNISGSYNVASGYASFESNTTGSGNTVIGYWGLNLTTASNYITAIGYKAGHGFNHGWNNTFIGAESNVMGTGFFNSIAIGSVAAATASNQARIGNSSTTSIGGFVNWTNISDGRFKKNIQEDVMGLDFIMKLRPVTYRLDIVTLSKQLNEQKSGLWNEDMQKALSEKEKMVQSGFVAQEVENAAKELGYDFSGVDKPKNEKDFYGLRYAEFVVPLVKAVQEQQEMIKFQQSQVDELKKAIKELRNQ
jgi:hypothetical protein